MLATAEATEGYHRKHPGLRTAMLGRTGLCVSGAGFGGYRVSTGVEQHRQALRRALGSGINLIDTSTNYADGGSEQLVGETLAEMVREGTLAPQEVVVVTKAGYLQGSNYEMARERLEAGGGFPDVVEYAPGLWHCIAPEFLEDQLTRSLQRLGARDVDVLLLHNPEYYLSWAAKNGVPLEEARAEYYRRIGDAFTYLESEVERGRLGWYGISSNSFPHAADAADFTSLEEVVKIAEKISLVHHFAVIQFPANLVETGFVTEANQSDGRTLMDVARRKNLGVLVNRPLNAIVGNQLIRLAEFSLGDMPVDIVDVRKRIAQITEEERKFLGRAGEEFNADPEGVQALHEFLTVGTTMERYWETFGSIEHFNDVLSQHFAPRLGYVMQYLRRSGSEEHQKWYTSYVHDVRALLHAVGAYYSRDAHERALRIKDRICHAAGACEGRLSTIAVRMLLGVEGVDSVLVGMRREEYVDDVVEALRQGPLGTEESWRRLNIAEVVPAEE